MQVRSTGCCAIAELVDISTLPTPEDVLQQSVGQLWWLRPKLVYFTGVTTRTGPDHASSRRDNYGQALVTTITTFNLGSVEAIKEFTNPKTNNALCWWVWEPDYVEMQQLYPDQCHPDQDFDDDDDDDDV